MEITGSRIAEFFDPKDRKFKRFRTAAKVLIKIDGDFSTKEEALRKALSNVFFAQNEPVVSAVPEYWRWVLEHLNASGELPPPAPKDPANPGGCPAAFSLENPCRVGNDVKAPKVISAPDPSYDELARQSLFQGKTVLWVVVDESGSPQRVRLSTPLGFGLDERAVEMVEKWKFKPATLNGQRVPVEINVEVNFRLY